MPSEFIEASHHWAKTDIPGLDGRTAVITGASTGLGFEVAGRGATVIMACRNAARAEAAAERIQGTAPREARVRATPLHLASLASVGEAADPRWLVAKVVSKPCAGTGRRKGKGQARPDKGKGRR